jgi:hypothetical protein
MSKLELTSLSCTNCGASLSGYEGLNEMTCDYCNTKLKILRPRLVSVTQDKLSTDNFDRLTNYIEILQKAIRAGNFNEGYEYCNKALEVNPNIGSIWENKAICAFWRSVSFLNEDKITISNAREIRTFLNASKENDPNSESYELTADAIGSNLATILFLKLGNTSTVTRVKDYIETIETAYDIMINKDIDIYKKLVVELSNQGNLQWWGAIDPHGNANDPNNAGPTQTAINTGIDVKRKRDTLINKIHSIENDYIPPNIIIKTTTNPTHIAVAVTIIVVLLAIISGNS